MRTARVLGWTETCSITGMRRPSRQQELAADALIRTWIRAMSFRRLAEAELRAHHTSFALWWVLYTTDQLISELDDDHAISQQAVSLRTELDKSTVSYLMGVLADRSLGRSRPRSLRSLIPHWTDEQGRALARRIMERDRTRSAARLNRARPARRARPAHQTRGTCKVIGVLGPLPPRIAGAPEAWRRWLCPAPVPRSRLKSKFEFTHRQRGEGRKMQCRNNRSYRGLESSVARGSTS